MSRNFSYTYLLPLLSEQVNLTKEILTYVLDTYIITNKNKNQGKFYMLCKFNYSDKNFTNLEDQLTNNDLYNTSYEINELILYEFNFPDFYLYEQVKFKEGKYSEFKNNSKKLILEFWISLYGHIPSFVTTTLLKIKQILYKEEKLRLKMIKEFSSEDNIIYIKKGSELGNKIDEKKETYFFQDEKEKITLNDLKNIFN